MRLLPLLLLSLLFPAGSLIGEDQLDTGLLRVMDGERELVKVAWGVRLAPGSKSVVAVIQGWRGTRLFVRYSEPAPGTKVNEIWMDGPPVVTISRRGSEPAKLEAAGRSIVFYPADLDRPTVRCWVGTLISLVHPKLLDASRAVQLADDAATRQKIGEALLPLNILWKVNPLEAPRGENLHLQEGAFAGEEWDSLRSQVLENLGRR